MPLKLGSKIILTAYYKRNVILNSDNLLYLDVVEDDLYEYEYMSSQIYTNLDSNEHIGELRYIINDN